MNTVPKKDFCIKTKEKRPAHAQNTCTGPYSYNKHIFKSNDFQQTALFYLLSRIFSILMSFTQSTNNAAACFISSGEGNEGAILMLLSLGSFL